jgi:hypothetical protein
VFVEDLRKVVQHGDMRRSRASYLQVASVDIAEDQVGLFVFRLDVTCNVRTSTSTPALHGQAPPVKRVLFLKVWAYWARPAPLYPFYLPLRRFDQGIISIINCFGMSDLHDSVAYSHSNSFQMMKDCTQIRAVIGSLLRRNPTQ